MSRKMQNINIKKEMRKVKIYDYGGKKNICGDRIRQARALRRISQSELAARM